MACFQKIASLLSGYRGSSCKEGDSVSWGTLHEPWPRPLRRLAPAVTELQTPLSVWANGIFGYKTFERVEGAMSVLVPRHGRQKPCVVPLKWKLEAKYSACAWQATQPDRNHECHEPERRVVMKQQVLYKVYMILVWFCAGFPSAIWVPRWCNLVLLLWSRVRSTTTHQGSLCLIETQGFAPFHWMITHTCQPWLIGCGWLCIHSGSLSHKLLAFDVSQVVNALLLPYCDASNLWSFVSWRTPPSTIFLKCRLSQALRTMLSFLFKFSTSRR